ncbi:hypothetical protein C8R48DRAFT_780091 [Suillus tomentosus]|nr:hypothetical protein C8R48DRAFT_780091 [Suillus tomentosus]
MSKRTASESHDEPTPKRVRNHEGTRVPSPLADHSAWRILQQYLTTSMTYPQMEAAFSLYLGDQHNTDDWKDARDALFSGDGDNNLALANLLALKARHVHQGASGSSNIVTSQKGSSTFTSAPKAAGRFKSARVRRPKNPFIDDEASEDDEEEEGEEEENSQVESDDDPSVRSSNIIRLPGPLSAKDRLAVAIDHIFNRYEENAPSTCRRATSSSGVVQSKMYLLHEEWICGDTSPWIPSQLYAISDSPRTIATSLNLLSSSVKDYVRILEEEQAAVEHSRSTLPNPGWVKITQGKYKGDISYVFDSEQANDFVAVLIPPRDFPYNMPPRSVALLNRASLPNDKTVSDIVQDNKVVGCLYKGERYYMGLLLKNFRRDSLELVASPHANDIRLHLESGWDVPFFKKALAAFSVQFLRVGDSARSMTGEVRSEIGTVVSTDHALGSARLEFTLDGHQQELEFRLQDIERVFWVADMVRIVAGVYTGLEGYIIKKSEDLFHVCQEATNEEVEVSKYFLDHRPLTHVLQSRLPTQPDYDPFPKPKSLQIGDEIEVCAGEYVGKCGIVVIKDQLIEVPAARVQHIRPFKTLLFTKERGYDVKPRDVVTVARGPEFQTKGVVQSVDFLNACLTLISESNRSLVKVPIGFVMKVSNVNPDSFRNIIGKEVFIIKGPRKGYRATLYQLAHDECSISLPGQARITIKHEEVWNEVEWFNTRRIGYDFFLRHAEEITPPPDPVVPPELGSSEWSDWSSHNNIDSTDGVKTYNPWVANNAEDVEDAIADRMEKLRKGSPLSWLMNKEFALKLTEYHVVFKVSPSFMGGRLHNHFVSTACPDPFCGNNGPAPDGYVAVFCTSNSAGAALQHYHIPAGDLSPAPPRKKNQQCLILDGNSRGATARTSISLRFDQICLVEQRRFR